MDKRIANRQSEWFVPNFGPPKFRSFIGMLFLPYTGMVLSFTVIGSMISPKIDWNRAGAIVVIYMLGLGIAAHALDAVGSKKAKPWGDVFTSSQLWFMAGVSLTIAYIIAAYCMVLYAPWLSVIAVLEGFFVFSYNLEWFKGRFHTDGWFAFSWGFLPVLAGYLIQTNTVSLEAFLLAGSMALFSRVEIKASRHYKALKQRAHILNDNERIALEKYEAILKSISSGVILLATAFLVGRMAG